MTNIRRVLIGTALSVMACGFANASDVVQTFALPMAPTSSAFNWSSTDAVNSYSYYQDLDSTTYGNLNSVTVTYSWSADSFGSATDSSAGSPVNYTWSAFTTVTLQGDAGSGVSFSDLKACSDSSFTNQTDGETMTELGCPVSSSGLGNYTSGVSYNYFLGTGPSPDTINLTGGAGLTASFSGGSFINASANGNATMSVSVDYNYSAPPPPSSTPEPATMFLMGSALAGVGLLRKRIKS